VEPYQVALVGLQEEEVEPLFQELQAHLVA